MTYKLRDYQKEAVEKGLEILNSKKPRKGLLVLPTGAGKSLIVAELARTFNKPLICLQPSLELLQQNFQKLIDSGGEATIYSASMNERNLSHLTFATIGTLIKAKKELKEMGVKHIVVDEAHLKSKSGSQLHDLVKEVGITHIVGLTASPVYLEGGMEGSEVKMMTRVRGGMFKSIDYVHQIQDMVKNKFWSELTYKIVEQNEELLTINSSGSDFTQESLVSFYEGNKIEEQIVEEVALLREEGRKSVLVFVPTIEEAEKVASRIEDSHFIHSKMNATDREEIVTGFKNLTIPVVINVSVLSTGFDHPQLDGIVLARSTMSIALFYQMLGRACRIHPDKKDAKIVDLSNSYKRFGKLEDLNFENIEGWGWGMFSNDILLTNFPLKAEKRPTKKSLLAKVRWEQDKEKSLDKGDATFGWGKFKGKKVSEVMKENKSYLTWLLDQKDFNWYGDNGKRLKESIQRHLGVFVEPVAQNPLDVNPKNSSINNYTNSIKTIADLKNAF
jgi:DNA repair protein RadD